MRGKIKRIAMVVLSILIIGFLVPEPIQIPVAGATHHDWNKDSYWYEPWGSSGVHKGVDIFAKKGTDLIASTHLLLLYKGEISKGGKIIVAIGPKWRIHYFAHLEKINENAGIFARVGDKIGSVGDTSNALAKSAHLHYSIASLLPYIWRIDGSTQGMKKAFYLNPIRYLNKG